MSDTTEAPATTTPQPNTPEARLPDGTLKDVQTTTPSSEGEQKPTETKPDDKAPTKPQGAPETYAEFTAPEGYTIDKAVMEKALPLFKEAGLSQEQAQKFVSMQAERELALAKAPQEAYDAMRDGWRKEVLADKTLASNNELLPEVKSAISKTVDALGEGLAKPFRELMDFSGLGDNPTFVRALLKFSESVVEGKHVTGGGPAPTGQKAPGAADRPSLAASLYPNLP